jgi:hypothetical protein
MRSTQAAERGPKDREHGSLFIGEPVQATEHGSTSKGGCTGGTPEERAGLSLASPSKPPSMARGKASSAKDREHGSLSL